MEIRRISRENHFAALRIQKVWRSHYTRCCLVQYGGVKWVRRMITLQSHCRAFLARRRVRVLGLIKLHHCAHMICSMYYRWKARRMKKLFSLAVMKKAVIKLQRCYRRRAAKKLFNLIRSIRMKKAATKIQSCARRRQGYMKSKMRRLLMSNVIKGTIPYPHTSEEMDITLFFQFLTQIALKGDFSRAYKISESLVNRYRRLSTIDSPPVARSLSYWNALSSVFLSSATYWSKFGPTRQLNAFILERSLGVLMQHTSIMKASYESDHNPYLTESRSLQLEYLSAITSDSNFNSNLSLLELLDVFYQLASSPTASVLKLFDAFILKADILMMRAWLSMHYAALNLQPHATPSIKTPSNHITSHRLVRKIWQLLMRAKNLLSEGSSDQFELKYRLELYSSLSQNPEASRESYRSLPLVMVKRAQAPNFRAPASIAACGVLAMCRIEIVRCGFIVFITGRIEQEPQPQPHVLQREASKGEGKLKDKDSSQPPKVFSISASSASLEYKQKESLLSLAQSSLAASSLLRPCMLFANEIDFLAETHGLYVTAKASKRLSAELSTISSSRVQKAAVDYRKLNAYLLEQLHLTLLLPSSTAMGMRARAGEGDGLESPWQLNIPVVDARRLQMLEKNDSRYSALYIQRIFRGYKGRVRYAQIAKNYYLYKRKRWLAWKVLYHWRRLRQMLDWHASLIQSRVKGWVWRKRLVIMKEKILFIQCLYRCHRARQRVQRERDRKKGGPAVVEMLQQTGRTISIGDRRCLLRLYRCGNNYRMQGMDMLRGMVYHGHVYADQLGELIVEHNIMHGKKLRIWQFEAVGEYIVSHLALIHSIYAGTNALAQDHDTSLALIVSNTIQGVFTDEPSMRKVVAIRPGRRGQTLRPINNLDMPLVRRLLPPLHGADHTPSYVKLMKEKKKLLDLERASYTFHNYGSSSSGKSKKKVVRKK